MIDRNDRIIDSARCGGSTYVLAEHGASYIIYCDERPYKFYSSFQDAWNYFRNLK